MRRGRVLALSLTAALSAGCTLDLSGLPARADSGGTSAVGSSTSVSGTSTSASASTGSGGAGGAGGAVATSSTSVSSSGTTLPCTATGAEICDDGIDNDCNQATDCEDPACAVGFVCLPAIPSGWSAVAFSAQSRPACPAGYATALDVLSAPPDPSTCSCTCTEQKAASCSEGTVDIASNAAGACPAAPNFPLDAKGSQCGGIDVNSVANDKAKASPLPPTQGMCSGTPAGTTPPPAGGRSCEATALGTGCPNGGACVTSPGAPFVACVAHDGVTPCPAGFPNASPVGTSADDTRSCTQCTCGTSATCSSPKLTFYTDGGCATGALDIPLTGSCDPLNGAAGVNYKSYKYTANIVSPQCQTIADSTPTGSFVLMGARTVCCQ